ncbi:amino acid ABC transporter ATP-binding/permease protein [Caulobacter henricii]|uniref:ABC transporter ATP-binding protein n=1 Tax=Caulobacter henricii TaxID=69395 RepID=A0A0P0NWJ7_9CAUL|nr:ATP-binding cassette domain-containing protein [Caulobacter henricii]ALL12416.1 ABC transporter ATP-binding protein [Caulobacter henricii]
MSPSPLQTLIRLQRRRHAEGLWLAAICAAVVGGASTLLLGLSGWFITASFLAGLAGLASAQAFNVLLPSATIRLLAILRTGARYGERLSGHAAALKSLAAIRPVLFSALAAAPPAEALSLSGGEASARLVQDVDAIETRFVRLSAPWGAGAAVTAGLGLGALAGWGPALAILVSAAAALLIARALARRFSAPAGREIQTRIGALKDATASLSAAAPELRAFGLEAYARQTLARRGEAVDQARLAAARARGWIAVSQATVLGLAVVAAVLLAAPAGAALAALAGLAATMAVEGVGAMASAFDQDGAADQAAERLDGVLRHAPRPATETDLPGLDLHFAGQDFSAGSRIAITGASGSGKTTLLERLMALRPSKAGDLRLGGHDLAGLDLARVRAAFALAPQDAALIAGTVADNLRLAAPDATEEAMWAALTDAALDTRIRAAPAGLNTWLGDNGERLSGGERRRLSLARAYLRPAPWLLLDEPTEGLDAATETRLLDRLIARLDRTGQGLVLVSHRPSPVAICERTVTLSAPST